MPAELTAEPPVKSSIRFTPQLLSGFLAAKEKEGRSRQTVATYRWNLAGFSEFLEEDKRITRDSLPRWREHMAREGYAHSTIHSRISTVNSFYDYLGRRDWQVADRQPPVPREGPELSREEYRTLLCLAKAQGNLQLYLLVKVLACTDLTPSDMPLLTREAVEEGAVAGKERGAGGPLELPEPLRSQLLEYARQQGIEQGPLFINGSRHCHNRGTIMKMIQTLAQEAGLPPGKANPRNLRRLHLSAQADIRKEADRWAARQYAALLLQEESLIAWQR